MSKHPTEAVQHSSENPNWRTPAALYAALADEFNFVLDAAALASVKLCPHYFGPDHENELLRDALAVNWSMFLQHGLRDTAIFLNPPYSRKQKIPIAPWIKKCWEESQKGCTIVGVIPFSSQTEWWRKYVEGIGDQKLPLLQFHAASEVRKIPHRVSFLREDGGEASSAGGNTAIVCWRPRNHRLAPWVPASSYWSYLKGLD